MSNLEKSQKPNRLGRGLGSLLGENVGGNLLNDPLPQPAVPLTPIPISVAKAESPAMKTEELAVVQNPEPKEIEHKTALKEAMNTSAVINDENRIWKVAIDKLVANTLQPRQQFNKEKIVELANSIKEQGILQPIVARKNADGKFEIIAGERRWRAAQQAGLHEVPVILKNVDDRKSLELALIENIQRENLNPIEEAEAYDLLLSQFSLTQAEVAEKVGKERSSVANSLRLLTLVPEVKRMLSEGIITAGHAKALLAITDPIKQKQIAQKIASERLTVRAAEKLVKSATTTRENTRLDLDVTQGLVKGLSEDLQKLLGTKVQIDYSNQKGKISIHFYSDDELTQISERLKTAWKKPDSTMN